MTEPPRAVGPFDAAQAKEHQNAGARHLGVEPEITSSVGMKLRLIPPGEFVMGSSPEQIRRAVKHCPDYAVPGVKREGPARPARIDEPCHLGACEVTVGQFRRLVHETGHKTVPETNGVGSAGPKDGKVQVSKEFTWLNPAFVASETVPVVCIDYEDTRAFCEWLSRAEGRRYEIPHESVWELACRAGTTGLWYWGDQPEGWEPFFRQGTNPVAVMPPNAFGLHDMVGNVQEFARADSAPFVFRGGSNGWNVWEARPARRNEFFGTDYRSGFDGGFRVAIVGDPTPPSPRSDRCRRRARAALRGTRGRAGLHGVTGHSPGRGGHEVETRPPLAQRAAERRVHADRVRRSAGNPLRPVALAPAWRTPTVVPVAQNRQGREAAGDSVLREMIRATPVGVMADELERTRATRSSNRRASPRR